MCETDRDHRATSQLYTNGGRSSRANNHAQRGATAAGFRRHGTGNGGTGSADSSGTPNNGNGQAAFTRASSSSPAGGGEPYKVQVSIRFVVTSLLASWLLAFCVGRASRIYMLRNFYGFRSTKELVNGSDNGVASSLDTGGTVASSLSSSPPPILPSIVAKNPNSVPPTRYLSKNFDTSMSVSSSSWLSASRDPAAVLEGAADTSGSSAQQQQQSPPMAEHLMVDIKHVDATFLNSEQELANAIIQVVTEANLTLLSYHCHGLLPMGVSCVGVLKQNYISFHTWPEEGVITLDLCVGAASYASSTAASQPKSPGQQQSLLPVLAILERAFGKPRRGSASMATTTAAKPETRWAHRVRGFPTSGGENDDDDDDGSGHDLGLYVLGDLATDVKKEVYSGETNFQKLDIYDVEDLNHEQIATTDPSLFGRRSKDTRHPVVFRPDRVVMRNGWVESTLFHEAAYHEALVHPAMMAHVHPQRVAIVGGGEGASLREVLKHKTVEKAVLIEMDESIVQLSKEFMPEWSDCSDWQTSVETGDGSWWCFDDSRTRLYHENALTWFVNRYAEPASSSVGGTRESSGESEKNEEELMDVVILNALSAESESAHANALYSNATYMMSFYNSLSDDGVLVMQLGESPDAWAADEMVSGDDNRVAALSLLEQVGFESIHAFEESHCGFGAAWTFIVAFKSYASRKHWYAKAAEIDVSIRKRILKTKSGETPLRYFDGATMVSYQVPSRTLENVFCRRHPIPFGCDDYEGEDEDDFNFDPEVPNLPTSSLEVKASSVGDNAGRGVYAKVDVAEDTYIAAETWSQSLRFYPSTYALILELLEKCPEPAQELEVLEYYMHGYGFSSRKFGASEVFVDSSIVTFVNHGCMGAYNVGERTSVHEFTADVNEVVEDMNGMSHTGTAVFNPVIDRHLLYSGDASLRDIQAGEELYDNYLAFIGGEDAWAEDVNDLRSQCLGQSTEGSVTEYESLYRTTDK